MWSIAEIEHVVERACELLERGLAGGCAAGAVEVVDMAQLPVIPDETQDQGLVGGRHCVAVIIIERQIVSARQRDEIAIKPPSTAFCSWVSSRSLLM
jgi:hypothetical protein